MTSPRQTVDDQTVFATAGNPEFTRVQTITERTGKDISVDSVSISLGDSNAPGATLYAATVDSRPDPSTVAVKLLIDTTIPAGTYRVWVHIHDSPETVARLCPLRLFVV